MKHHSLVIAFTLFFFFAPLSVGSLRAADQPKDDLITFWIREALRAETSDCRYREGRHGPGIGVGRKDHSYVRAVT